MADIERQLKEAALESGLSMLEISKRANVPYSAVHGFMTSDRRLSLRSGAKLAAMLGLELRPVQPRRKSKAR